MSKETSKDETKKEIRARILLTGTIACAEELKKEKEAYSEKYFSYAECFASMKRITNKADLTIGALSTEYSYPDDLLEALKDTGYDLLTLGIRKDEDGETLAEAVGETRNDAS